MRSRKEKAQFYFRLSLEKKLPLLISLLILLVIITLSWTAYFGVRRASLQVGQERLKALVEQFSDLFQQSSAKVRASTRELALGDSVVDFLLHPGQVDLDNYFRKQRSLRIDSLTLGLQVLDKNKNLLFSTRGSNLSFTEISDTTYSTASVSPDFSAMGKLSVHKDTMEYPILVCIRKNDRIIGYLARWRLVIASPKNIQNINKLLGENASLYIGNADNSFWTNFINPTNVHKFESGRVPLDYINTKNKPVLGAISGIPGTPWAFIIELSKNSILEASDRFLQWILTIDLLILLAGFILAWYMSLRITEPINKLASAAGRIAEGNYQEQVDVKRKDELGRLAYAFNTMSEKIRDAKNNLEDTVKKRTSQLKSANEELDELNKKLTELDQVKTNFFTNISHELRTPLTLILGPLEKLRQDDTIPEHSRKELRVIYRNAGVLLKQVNNLLDLSRLEAGKLRLNYEEFDLFKMINVITSQFELYKTEREIDLRINTPDELIIQADFEKVERIITNLVSNAFKFTPVGGELEISAEQAGDEAVVRIHDSGPGIDPALLNGIFERFHGTDVYLGNNTGSSGLGLSIVREFIELHKGKIIARNSDKGGAEFIFSLPLKTSNLREAGQAPMRHKEQIILKNPTVIPSYYKNDVHQSAATQTSRQTKGKRRGSILVVEDNEEMNEFITGVLTEKYDVECAFNGAEGIDKAINQPPDLIISDIMMPVMTGNEMILKLKEDKRTKNIPVIILSAKTEDIFIMEMLKSGAQDYLRKPFSIEELKVRTDNIIEMKLSKDTLRNELDLYSENLSQLVEELAEKKHLLESSLSEKTMLLKEVHHRVKNNLQIIASLLNLQTNVIKDPEMLEVFKESQNRIRSMALIHEKLYGSREGFAKIKLKDYVDDLILYLFQAYRLSASNMKSVVEMPDIIINLDSAISIGLILSELITNSIKHALNKQGNGILTVKYQEENGTGSTLSVSDNGKGFSAPEDENSETLGMVIIKTLTEQLNGSYEIISNNGTEVLIHFPYSLETGTKENQLTREY